MDVRLYVVVVCMGHIKWLPDCMCSNSASIAAGPKFVRAWCSHSLAVLALHVCAAGVPLRFLAFGQLAVRIQHDRRHSVCMAMQAWPAWMCSLQQHAMRGNLVAWKCGAVNLSFARAGDTAASLTCVECLNMLP